MRGPARSFTRHEVDVIRNRVRDGETIENIIEDYQVSRITAYNALYAVGAYRMHTEGALTPKPRKRRAGSRGKTASLTTAQCANIRAMHDAEMHLDVIAGQMEVSAKTVRKVLECTGAYANSRARVRNIKSPRRTEPTPQWKVDLVREMVEKRIPASTILIEVDISHATLASIKAGKGRFALDRVDETNALTVLDHADAHYASFSALPRYQERIGLPDMVSLDGNATTIREMLVGRVLTTPYAQALLDFFVARQDNPASITRDKDNKRVRQELIEFLTTRKEEHPQR